jgi:hypothetical protein
MTQAFNLSQFANKLNTSGQTDNTGLQNSSVTVTAGTGMSGGGAVALGSSVTLNNAGVTSIVAGTGISVSGATGAVTVTNSATSAYVGQRAQVFTSNGTFTIPTGVTALKVTVVGGGGGGSAGANGTNGGNSTVSSGTQSISTITGNGGLGATGQQGGSGSSASGGELIIGGSNGEGFGGSPGTSYFSTGRGVRGYGNGGQGVEGGEGPSFGSGGGAGTAIKWLTSLTAGNTLTVVIGGAGGPNSGTAGVVVFEW